MRDAEHLIVPIAGLRDAVKAAAEIEAVVAQVAAIYAIPHEEAKARMLDTLDAMSARGESWRP